MKRTRRAAWISVLVLSAPSTVTAEPLNRLEVESNANIGSFNSFYGDLSLTLSPFAPYYESGFKLRFTASDTGYSYPGDLARTFISKGNDIETDFLLGYGFQFDRWSLMLLAGPTVVWSHQMPGTNLFPSTDLTEVGAKTVASIYATPTDQTMFYAQGSLSSVNSIYYTQAKFGGALWPSIYVGPEVIATGRVVLGGVHSLMDEPFSATSFNITIQQWKVGAFISGLKIGPMLFGLSAGFLNDLQQGNGAYVSTSVRTTF
jgi:hypothetical protein